MLRMCSRIFLKPSSSGRAARMVPHSASAVSFCIKGDHQRCHYHIMTVGNRSDTGGFIYLRTKYNGTRCYASVSCGRNTGLTEEERSEAKKASSCVECEDKRSTKKCDQCGDGYCTKCFRKTHASGRRTKHTWTHVGPMECAECEAEVSEETMSVCVWGGSNLKTCGARLFTAYPKRNGALFTLLARFAMAGDSTKQGGMLYFCFS